MTTNAELLERHRAVLPNWLALYYDPPISFDRGPVSYPHLTLPTICSV